MLFAQRYSVDGAEARHLVARTSVIDRRFYFWRDNPSNRLKIKGPTRLYKSIFFRQQNCGQASIALIDYPHLHPALQRIGREYSKPLFHREFVFLLVGFVHLSPIACYMTMQERSRVFFCFHECPERAGGDNRPTETEPSFHRILLRFFTTPEKRKRRSEATT